MAALTPSEMKAFIEECLMIREIPYIAGPPGIGKSDVVAQVADEYNLKLLDIRLSQMLTEDLTGIPQIDPNIGKARYLPFNTFPMVGDQLPVDAKGNPMNGWLIFLDELSSASEEVMAAIYSLLLGHTIGGHKVHPKALIVAAGNRSIDSAIARDLPDTLITRMLPREMRADINDWVGWATSNRYDLELVGFLKKYPDMLIGMVDPNKRGELETYPTPRGWSKVNKALQLHAKQAKTRTRVDSAGIPLPDSEKASVELSETHKIIMRAAVGEMAAQAFVEHYNEAVMIPYPWDIAQSPSSARIPASQTGRVEVIHSLVDHFLKTKEQSRDAIIQYMNRMDGEERELFSDMLEQKLGSTASDKRLMEGLRKRLDVAFTGPVKTPDPDELDQF